MGNIDDKCLSRFMFCNKFHKKSVSMAVRMALIPMLMLPAASQAVITVPVHSEDRVHFADLNPDFPLAGLDNNFVRIKELRKPFSLSTFDVENQPIRLFIFIR